ncbi:V4R domain-containing protein [Phaeovulum sp. W22_SRMD_FR3]|uniref:V4R domain-containing protein n=1 Tax=Phaeovulum sp. W22_SRMD_FR3 TaxID=3240274 RepID=UPI003F971DF0
MDMTQGFHARLQISPERGEMRDGDIRYLMMRPDALMGAFMRLPDAARAQALAALGASVAEHGGRSVATYRAHGAAAPEALWPVITATSAALGWGVWEAHPAEAGALEITVRNSPFAAGAARADGPVCAAITGLLSAVAPVILRNGATARETACAAETGESCCHFRISL